MDESFSNELSAFEEMAAASEGTAQISPQRLQYLMNQSAAHLGQLANELKNNMSELRIVTSLMKGAVDLWHTSRSS